MTLPPIAIPGQTLGSASSYAAGLGTHVYNGNLCASTLGSVIEGSPSTQDTKSGKVVPTLSIPRAGNESSPDTKLTNILPEVKAVVLARVTRINPRQASVAILVVGEMVCADEFPGIIRSVWPFHV